jgi:hypothetical protein
METNEALLITLLVLTIVMFLFVLIIYGKVVAIFEFYRPEIPPPASLRFTDSFLSTKKPLN